MVIGRRIDQVLEALKWPIGVFAVLMLGPLCYATLLFAARIWQHPWSLIWFVAGILAYAFAWRPFMRRWLKTDWMLTVEHELTHALFALLTGHRVKSFQVTRKGGRVEVVGGSNWLIALAPYFFPTAPLILLLFAILMPLGTLLPWTGLFLGFSMAYHVRSTWTETHGAQTDFDQAGRWFSLIFLPSANLCAIGLVASFAVGGWDGMQRFSSDASAAIQWLVMLIPSALTWPAENPPLLDPVPGIDPAATPPVAIGPDSAAS
ncbi:hypothetical protein CA51_00890 [Rosistilla oblonga]|uniref:M50 family metallopeptidase n=1 Tax=Rosistilla oblonga TaxID=2527990 RepID=UPI0011894458|nr:M50 family metallopeptidase [Rosistilla oblonga]QDV10247.1 hypothetical protein CA51_00890 [Rosistilla oblonga]